MPAASVTAANVIDAAKDGNEYRPDPGGLTWTLRKKVRQPVMRIDPEALGTPEMEIFTRTFRLKRGLTNTTFRRSAQSVPVHLPAGRGHEHRSGDPVAAAGAVLRFPRR